jgi:hypothetical protein
LVRIQPPQLGAVSVSRAGGSSGFRAACGLGEGFPHVLRLEPSLRDSVLSSFKPLKNVFSAWYHDDPLASDPHYVNVALTPTQFEALERIGDGYERMKPGAVARILLAFAIPRAAKAMGQPAADALRALGIEQPEEKP